MREYIWLIFDIIHYTALSLIFALQSIVLAAFCAKVDPQKGKNAILIIKV